MRSVITHVLLVIFLINLGACSYLTGPDGIFRDRKKDYRKSESAPRMAVVESHDDAAIVDLYPVPPASPFSDGEMIDEFSLPSGVVDQKEPVVMQTLGDTQWLLLQASPSQVWPRLKEFISSQSLTVSIENGTAGMIEAVAAEGVYRFRIRQGFQRNMAELSARYIADPSQLSSFWPDSSTDAGKESEMLGLLSAFFREVSDKPAYSFAAQGISTQKVLNIEHDVDGAKVLVMKAGLPRAMMAVEQSLKDAGFTVKQSSPGQKTFDTQYTPPMPVEKKPNIFKKLFFIKPDPYDKSAKYAGEHFRFTVTGDGDNSRLVATALDVEGKTPELLRREQNYILLLLKEHLY